MIQANGTQGEEVVKEIILEETTQPKEDNQNSNKTTALKDGDTQNDTLSTPQFVEKKQIPKLTADERALIIKNHIDGVDQPFYQVKQFKNGNFTIMRKKEQRPSVTERVVRSEKPPENISNNSPAKVYYSDNQLLFEHIIELNSKVDKLMNKHKKLKRRYQNLQQDIYEDDAENETNLETSEIPQGLSQGDNSIRSPANYSNHNPTEIPQGNNSLRSQRGWRSRLTYL